MMDCDKLEQLMGELEKMKLEAMKRKDVEFVHWATEMICCIQDMQTAAAEIKSNMEEAKEEMESLISAIAQQKSMKGAFDVGPN